MRGIALRIGKHDYTLLHFSPYSNFYHITFNRLTCPARQKSIMAELQILIDNVLAGFNPSNDRLLKSSNFRAMFASDEIPPALIPKNSELLCEIQVIGESRIPTTIIFQHKYNSLNKKSTIYTNQTSTKQSTTVSIQQHAYLTKCPTLTAQL